MGLAGENGIFSDYNLFFSNTANYSDVDPGPNDFEMAPLFIAANDYRIGPGSPASAAGVDAGVIDSLTSKSHVSIGALQPESIPSILADGGDQVTLRATVLVSAGQSADSVYLDLDPGAEYSAAGATSSAAAVGATTTLTATITLTGTDKNHLVKWRLRIIEDDGTVTLLGVNYTVVTP